MTDRPRFCRACAHIGMIIHKVDSVCHHPSAITNPVPNLVTGEPMQRAACWQMRKGDGACGIDGLLFQAADEEFEPEQEMKGAA